MSFEPSGITMTSLHMVRAVAFFELRDLSRCEAVFTPALQVRLAAWRGHPSQARSQLDRLWRLLTEERSGPLTSAYFQKAFVSQVQGRVSLPHVEEKLKALNLYRPRGHFSQLTRKLKSLAPFELFMQMVLAPGRDFAGGHLSGAELLPIYNTMSRGYLGRELSQVEKEELLRPQPLQRLSLARYFQGPLTVRIGRQLSASRSQTAITFTHRQRGVHVESNYLEILEELLSLEKKLQRPPTRACRELNQAVEKKQLPGFLKASCTATQVLQTGGGAINPLLQIRHFCLPQEL